MAELINPSSYNDFTLQTLMTPDGITRLNSLLSQLSQNIAGDTENVRVFQGVGTPEASIAAGVGSLYMRTDGSTDTSIYRKESGSGDTGWVAVKAPASLPLSVTNGGFGADNSAVAQGYIPYMSATGVISWLAVGTSGQYLKTQGAGANPTWSVLSNIPKVIFANAVSATTGSVTVSTSVSTSIDSSGDWTGKAYAFIGTLAISQSSSGGCPAASPDITGSNVVRYSDFTVYSKTHGNGCTGNISANVSISGGNLVLTASYSPDSSNTSASITCTVTGIFIREP